MSDQIGYYRQVQPFQRDTSDLNLFLNTRNALYRHLGIVPAFLFRQSIVEFGPGFGENAILPLLHKPRRYVLVDSNENCLEKTRDRLTPHRHPDTQLDYRLCTIDEFHSDETFDLVICESVIPREIQPEKMLLSVARHVSMGGVLIITCQDQVSTFAELLRRLITLLVVPLNAPLEDKLARLVPLFEPHLKTIQGMNRSPSNWILDNLLRPWEDVSFSIVDAIHALRDRFDVHGTSPRFITDSRWHRIIQSDDPGFNDIAEKDYYSQVHNLINHREWTPAVPVEKNKQLLEMCLKIFELVRTVENQQDRNLVPVILDHLQTVIELAADFSVATGQALRDYHRVLDRFHRSGVLEPFSEFAPLFGRGQQFASFVRRC
ncbi:MAG: class I SAM-dependent methyltransferase [Magnetococcales bacterium]|nr:class I SAM-dependent methyltransferase [Magnetococcales bacterium]